MLFFLGKINTMLPKPRFSRPIFGQSAGSTKLDRPQCKQLRTARYRGSISAMPPYCALWGFWSFNMANWGGILQPLHLDGWGGWECRARHAHPKESSEPRNREFVQSLRYLISRDTFSGRLALPQNGAIPPFGTQFHTGTVVRYPILQHIAR